MSDTGRRFEWALSAAVVVAFATFWGISWATNDPPKFPQQYVMTAFVVGVLATWWVFAVRILWRAWWAQAAVNQVGLDGSARLLSLAVAMLPDERREWGAAMMAELAHVQGRRARWSFALGCAQAAIFPPFDFRVSLVAGLMALAALTTYTAVDDLLPGLRVFAGTFVLLVGGLATLAVARGWRAQQVMRTPIFAITGFTSVAACIAVAVDFLVKHPEAGEHLTPIAAVTLAGLLAGSLWLTVAPPRCLEPNRLARGFGIGGALVLGLGYFVTSRLTIDTTAGPLIWGLFAPPLVFGVLSVLSTYLGRSFGVGIQSALWAAVLGTLLVFAISIPEAMHRYAIDGRILSDGEWGLPIGVNLRDAIWMLVVLPVLGLPFGVFGAAMARRLQREAPPLMENSR